MSKISIIIPVYNVEKYIEKCIDSCIEQTLKDIEIIVVDDQSSDKSLEIVKKLKNIDNRIRIFTQKNSGVSVARNKGIEEAKSDWIMFLDGDDWLERNTCETMFKYVMQEECDILVCGFFEELINETKVNKFLKYDDKIFYKSDNLELIKNCIYKTNMAQENLITNIGVPWAKLYSKDYLNKNNIRFTEGLKRMQDMVFNLDAFYKASKICYNSIPVYHYRCQNNSVTNKYSPDFDETSKKILEAINKFIKKNNLEEELKDFYRIKSFFLFDEIIMLKYVPKENKSSIFNKLYKIHKLRKEDIFYKNKSLKLNIYFNIKLSIKNFFYCIGYIHGLYLIDFYKYKKRTNKNYKS